MSGFFGIVRSDGEEVDSQLLHRVADTLRARGSDNETIWQQRGTGTCFAYLATGPARQASQQPVVLGENWLIGDIRMDAQRELFDQLHSEANHPSPDPTSEELLLRAWQTWGESSLQKILGDFSFALWDQNHRSLWCARDFFGPRPFYYARKKGIFCFSNTLAAFRLVPEVSSALDEIFIGEYLLRGYPVDLSRTVYTDIRRLPAGYLLRYHEESLDVRRFMTLPIEEPLRFSQPDEYLDAYRHVLREAVQDRLPRGATALELSGGIDSGTVCAMACELARSPKEQEKLEAFTIGWRPLFKDPEPRFALLSATHLGLKHHLLEEPHPEPFATSPGLTDLSPEPCFEPFSALIQKYDRKIANHSAVILSGYGGDDILTGRPWPYITHLWVSGERFEIARSLGRYLWAHGTLPPLRAGMKAKLRRLAGNTDEWDGYPVWLNPDFAERCGLRERWRHKPFAPDTQHPVHPYAYAALHSGFWSSVLESEDAGNSHVVLETRAPLLDLRVVRFLLRVPPVPWCVHKELARHSFRGKLPERVLNRPKTPLLEDPLKACIDAGQWSPIPPLHAVDEVQRFIDWDTWVEALKYARDCTSGPFLFPLTLVDWLKAIENV